MIAKSLITGESIVIDYGTFGDEINLAVAKVAGAKYDPNTMFPGVCYEATKVPIKPIVRKSVVSDFNDEARRLRRLKTEHLARLAINDLRKPAEIYVTWEENQR